MSTTKLAPYITAFNRHGNLLLKGYQPLLGFPWVRLFNLVAIVSEFLEEVIASTNQCDTNQMQIKIGASLQDVTS